MKNSSRGNQDGYNNWIGFLAALRPDWEERPTTEDIIHDEVQRQVKNAHAAIALRSIRLARASIE